MSDTAAETGRVHQLITTATALIAPTTLFTALLFYFGYAFTKAQYAYFGLDVATIGLSTQDYVMRSPTPLVLPALILALLAAAVMAGQAATLRRIDADPVGAAAGRWRTLSRVVLLGGVAAMSLGTVLLAVFALGALRDWALLPLVTAALYAAGATASLVGLRFETRLGRRPPSGPTTVLPLYVVLIGGVFWAAATLAPSIGRGEARTTARHLDQLPAVIVDTREKLYLRSPGILESRLDSATPTKTTAATATNAASTAEDQTFHYRYRRLRLLIQGDNLMFLVPDTWSASNSTLVLPIDDGSVRVQFQFQNDPP